MVLSRNDRPGTTPTHVILSPDEKRLLVANADNNTVAVVDIATPGRSQVEGLIPTGWYPTAAMFSGDARQIFVLSGKGLSSEANPRLGSTRNEYVGALMTGSLSFVPVPGLRGEGMPGLLVCSGSGEQTALVELADVVVDGPAGVLALLRQLTADLSSA